MIDRDTAIRWAIQDFKNSESVKDSPRGRWEGREGDSDSGGPTSPPSGNEAAQGFIYPPTLDTTPTESAVGGGTSLGYIAGYLAGFEAGLDHSLENVKAVLAAQKEAQCQSQ